MTVHGYELKNGLARFFRWLDGFFAGLSGLILIAMMLTISYDVIARYAFGAPTKWSLEVNEYFLLAVVYLSGAWTLRVGGHVRVDILLQRLSDRTKTKLEVFDSILGAPFWCAPLSPYDRPSHSLFPGLCDPLVAPSLQGVLRDSAFRVQRDDQLPLGVHSALYPDGRGDIQVRCRWRYI